MLFDKLLWLDKIHLLDIAHRMQADYLQKVYDKVILNLTVSDPRKVVEELGKESLIQFMVQITSLKPTVGE